MKRIISILMLAAVLLSAFAIPAFATDDDNAQSGDGNIHDAVEGYGWYNPQQYLWKVTLFVGKSDQACKQSNLVQDFHRMGTLIMKKSGWTLPAGTKFASGTKVDYCNGFAMTLDPSPYIISDSNCPAVPVACGGNIETVKSYFGSTGTLTTVLNGIAADKNTTKQEMLSALSFTIGGQTKTGWEYAYVAPNATTNRVPWLIVYEPMVVMNLKDKTTKLAFTATEFALGQLNGWYNWGGGTGQNVASLTRRHLPTSVQLEESWFGYPVYAVTSNEQKWAYEDIVKGGGWGMRWLPAAIKEPEQTPVDDTYDFSVSDLTVTPNAMYQGDYCLVSFISDNWNVDLSYQDILVEVLLNNEVVKSDYVDFRAYGRNRHSYTLWLEDVGNQSVSVRINWANRNAEANRNNNRVTSSVSVSPYYDFGISELTVDPVSCYERELVKVTFRTDSWDQYNAYENVPVELLYNDQVIYTEYVDYDVFGLNRHSITVNVGDTAGVNNITARINWEKRSQEAHDNDNITATVQLTVKERRDLAVLAIMPNSPYRAGTTVITSFKVINNSRFPVLPGHNNTVAFEAYYLDGRKKVTITTQTWEQVVIPDYDNNLVYFKWTVPTNAAGKTIYCKATVNADHTIDEINTGNNADILTPLVVEKLYSQTPDTQFEKTRPDGFKIPAIAKPRFDEAYWSMWIYQNGEFVRREYGLTISSDGPMVTPDEDCPTATMVQGCWQMPSGYGFYLNYRPVVTKAYGGALPDSAAYTDVQQVYALLPEYQYSLTAGYFRTMEKVGNTWMLEQNPYADNLDRLHFTPLWYPNGDYIPTIYATDVWTPAGMLTSTQNCNAICIANAAYDDWYVGEA